MKRRFGKLLLFLSLVAGALAVAAGIALVVFCDADFRRERLVRFLRERGVEASFEELSFGVVFSDSIRARGVSLVLPDGSRIRVEKFSAAHNGTLGLFSGEPSFRDFSCTGFALDDARGRRRFGFSFDAEEISAAFRPLAPIETFTRGEPLPFSVSAKNFRARAAGREIAVGDVSGDFRGAEPISLSGKIRGDFAALMAQPAFSKFDNVAAGAFTFEGSGRSANLRLENLRSRYGGIEIPEISVSAARGENATGTLGVALRGEERRSSAKIHFSRLEFGEGSLKFTADAEADTLVVADILRAGLLFRGRRPLSSRPVPAAVPPPRSRVPAASAAPKDVSGAAGGAASETREHPSAQVSEPFRPESVANAPATSPRPNAPASAFWKGVSGTADFRVRRVVFPENEVGEHVGRFSVSDESAAVEYVVPEFFEGSGRGRFSLSFSPEAPHYRLAGTASGSSVEVHRCVPALRARDPAPVLGKFDFSAGISAAADEPERLEDSLRLDFSLKNSGPGRVRIFNAKSKKIRLAGDVVRISGDLANLLGGLTRNLEPRASRLADVFGNLKAALTDFSYSEMRVEGEYRAGGDLSCRRFDVRGDEVRLCGVGGVRPVVGEPSDRWPIEFVATAFVRGGLADALRELGVLRGAGTPDADGFVELRRFAYAGSAERASEKFFETLMDAAAGRDVRDADDASPRAPAGNLLDAIVP
ncbi:MAG: hypothetical protein ACI4P3_00695 [Candidatus Spyradosoma sp.]